MKLKKVIITGCAGFIGSHLSELLLRLNHNIIGIDNINSYYDVSLKEKNLDVSQGWLYDFTDQIEWSLKILKENKHRDYKYLKNKYNKIMVT